jgi:hypothetical protein
MQHDFLHIRPEKYNVSEEVKNSIRQLINLVPKDIYSMLESSHPELTQKQVHFWWTLAIQEQYKKDNDQLVSAFIHLKESKEPQINRLLSLNVTSNIRHLAFITIFFDQMKNNNEIVVDATCKNLNFDFFFFNYCNFANTLYSILF